MTPAAEEPMATTHGSRILAALEDAWQAIQAASPDVPAVVLITGSGAAMKGTPEGYRLRGHHWPERWIHGQHRAPELFIGGEVLGEGGRAVLEVMLHEAAHALAAVRGIKDTSAEGGRYHNRRYTALAAELGLAPPARPDKVTGWSHCTITGQAAAGYAAAIAAVDAARLPYLADVAAITGTGQDKPGDSAGDGQDKPARRGGRRRGAECQCQPPRRLQVTPAQLEAGPIVCGVCGAEFQPPDDAEDQDQ